MHWYFTVLKNYALFGGRACRREFWMFMLINWLIVFALGTINGIATSAEKHYSAYPGILSRGSSVVFGLYNLAVLIPAVAVSVRRLHDTNRSGWWMLLVPAPHITLALALLTHRIPEPGGSLSSSSVILLSLTLLAFISQIVLLIFMVQDSQPGVNRYSPNPKISTL
ncbi:MAG: DUF805 domain-containing protein [Candidatus Loosdrechtia sp.]|uniref:DUF805 domain-containing protein n=1 Tax=Candidatus Loosdrechtia sp. TaxID=3101272 RepID=UPI003A68DF3A|nr:MAG: DUF805 domain-containing protein [Candidatus Jettenia sp. AMX2]